MKPKLRFAFNSPIFASILSIGTYFFWLWFVKLVFITLSTYYAVENRLEHFDLGDALRANSFTIVGSTAFLFLVSIHFLNPYQNQLLKDLKRKFNLNQFSLYSLEGSILAAALIIGSTWGGLLQFLGLSLSIEQWIEPLFFFFIFCLAALFCAITEEYLFLKKIDPMIQTLKVHPYVITIISALLYWLLKLYQFHLTPIEQLNQFLMGILLFYLRQNYYAKVGFGFESSSGFIFGWNLVGHAITSIPIFGHQVTGLFLFRTGLLSSSQIRLLGIQGDLGVESGLLMTILILTFIIYRLNPYFKKTLAN